MLFVKKQRDRNEPHYTSKRFSVGDFDKTDVFHSDRCLMSDYDLTHSVPSVNVQVFRKRNHYKMQLKHRRTLL